MYSSLYLVIEPLILTMRKLRSRSHWRHTPTRPPSAGYYQAFNVPMRRSAIALPWPGKPAAPGVKFILQTVRQRRAVGVRHSLQYHVDGPKISLDCAAVGRLSGPRDQSRGNRRQHSSTTGRGSGNLHGGSRVGHLHIASRAAEPKMPTNYTANDFLVVRLHPPRAPTISVSVTTRERVGRTIEPILQNLRF
jgi:hypothetical protein